MCLMKGLTTHILTAILFSFFGWSGGHCGLEGNWIQVIFLKVIEVVDILNINVQFLKVFGENTRPGIQDAT